MTLVRASALAAPRIGPSGCRPRSPLVLIIIVLIDKNAGVIQQRSPAATPHRTEVQMRADQRQERQSVRSGSFGWLKGDAQAVSSIYPADLLQLLGAKAGLSQAGDHPGRIADHVRIVSAQHHLLCSH
jgi:hypothetical protein